MPPATDRVTAPGPSHLEVLRSLPLILGDRLAWLEELHGKYGDLVRVPLGPRAVFVVFHPDYLRHVLVTNAKNYWKGRAFKKVSAFAKGVSTAEGEPWHQQRRRMAPHFRPQALRSVTGVVGLCIDRMLDRWSVHAKRGELVDLMIELNRLAMELLTSSLLGVETPAENVQAILDAQTVIMTHTTYQVMNPFDLPEAVPVPGGRKFKRAVGVIRDLAWGMIQEERRRTSPSGSLLGLLIDAEDPDTGERMSDEQLCEEVMTMLQAGSDSVGNSMCWIFYALHQHPEICAHVQAEVEQSAGSPDAPLDLTQRTIEETLRLFPQNWVSPRDTYEADNIGGYTIPAGTTVFLAMYIAQRRPDFWKDPLVFDPDRFLPEAVQNRHPQAYMPFGGGGRKCIGLNFAMIEMTSTVARVLRRFRVELTDAKSVRRHAVFALKPTPAMMARLTER